MFAFSTKLPFSWLLFSSWGGGGSGLATGHVLGWGRLARQGHVTVGSSGRGSACHPCFPADVLGPISELWKWEQQGSWPVCLSPPPSPPSHTCWPRGCSSGPDSLYTVKPEVASVSPSSSGKMLLPCTTCHVPGRFLHSVLPQRKNRTVPWARPQHGMFFVKLLLVSLASLNMGVAVCRGLTACRSGPMEPSAACRGHGPPIPYAFGLLSTSASDLLSSRPPCAPHVPLSLGSPGRL